MSLRPTVGRALRQVPAPVHRLLPSAVRAELRVRWGWTHPGDVGFRSDPPPAGPGCAVGPPDFIVPGVADAGARGWFEAITRHPEIARPEGEAEAAHFFADLCTSPCDSTTFAAFQRWFPRRPGQQAGHWSPDGLAYPWVTPLLAAASPEARWLVMLRDPIERLQAGLVRTEAERRTHVGSYLEDAVDRGFYSEQLEHLLTVIPADRLLVAQSEAWIRDPDHLMAEVDRFLELDHGRRSPVAPPRLPDGGSRFVPSVRAQLQSLYREDVDRLEGLVPGFDRTLWPNFTGSA